MVSSLQIKSTCVVDPNFGCPGRIDILLRAHVDVYANIVLKGQQTGSFDAPVAFETEFGRVLWPQVNCTQQKVIGFESYKRPSFARISNLSYLLNPARCLLSLLITMHLLINMAYFESVEDNIYLWIETPTLTFKLHGKHPISHLIIWTEHLCLLHAGPTLLASSLNQRYQNVEGWNGIRLITHACVTW